MDIDKQAAMYAKRINVADFKDPRKLDKFITRFTRMWEAYNGSATLRPPPAMLLGAAARGGHRRERTREPAEPQAWRQSDAARSVRFAVGPDGTDAPPRGDLEQRRQHLTAGFRAEEIKFEQLVSQTDADPTAFVSPGITYLSRRRGELVKTDNPFDVAVKGDAWLAIQTPAGRIYTRDGRMQMTPTGELQTLNGYPILDVGGAPIQLDPTGGTPSIARDGTITQGTRQIGALGLFTIPETASLTRYENSGVIPDRAAEPALDFTRSAPSRASSSARTSIR